jgi:AbrB family looped-hinge helix DNA binding protein
MGEVTVEDRGRIVIPKEVREKLGIRGGETMRVEERDGNVVISPVKSRSSLKELRGVIRDSEIEPSEIKGIWEE